MAERVRTPSGVVKGTGGSRDASLAIEYGPMMPMPPRSARTALVLAAFHVSGCAADPAPDDYPTTEPVLSQRVRASSEADRPSSSEETKDLETRLYMKEEGKVVANAMRAHGGWDAWRSLAKVSYTRAISPGPGAPADVAGGKAEEPRAVDRDRFELVLEPAGLCNCRADPHPIHVEPPVRGGSGPDAIAAEYSLVALPFALLAQDLRKERLGVEVDSLTGERFEKLKVTRRASASGEWMVLYFDASTAVLKRVLRARAGGEGELALLSEWKETGGIRIATRREVHEVRRLFEHFDLTRPDRIEILGDLAAEKNTGTVAGAEGGDARG
jgi:hypothetical protein